MGFQLGTRSQIGTLPVSFALRVLFQCPGVVDTGVGSAQVPHTHTHTHTQGKEARSTTMHKRHRESGLFSHTTPSAHCDTHTNTQQHAPFFHTAQRRYHATNPPGTPRHHTHACIVWVLSRYVRVQPRAAACMVSVVPRGRPATSVSTHIDGYNRTAVARRRGSVLLGSDHHR